MGWLSDIGFLPAKGILEKRLKKIPPLDHIPEYKLRFSNQFFSPRKGPVGAGETIQSYNHQKKDPFHQRISMDDDNIDVVNDNDKDSGEPRCNHVVRPASSEICLLEVSGCKPGAHLMKSVKCKAVVLTLLRRSVCRIIRIHLNVKQVLISGFKSCLKQDQDKHWKPSRELSLSLSTPSSWEFEHR